MQHTVFDRAPLVKRGGGSYLAPAWCSKGEVSVTIAKFAGGSAAQSLVVAGTAFRALRAFLRYLFIQPEDVNGVRMSWNVWPRRREDIEHIGAPLGCLYSPFASTQNLHQVDYDPIKCQCGGVLNPFCSADFQENTWLCPFCSKRNPFPASYAEQISEVCLPWEMKLSGSTIEYITDHVDTPPVFLMLLDVASIADELHEAKDVLQHVCTMLPGDALIGLITFGANCFVHEMREMRVARSHAFKGNRSYSCAEVSCRLGLHEDGCHHSFILPVSECYHTLMSAINDAVDDSSRYSPYRRPLRCTGAALSIAVSLLEFSFPGCGARVMLITGGACTLGPGMVVGEDRSELMRSHSDVVRNTERARYVQEASSFYGGLATRASCSGLAVDICAASLEEVGLHEMRALIDRTGGSIIMADSFSMDGFKEPFRGLFKAKDTGELCIGRNADISIFTSEEFQCCGAIGALTSDNVAGPAVSKQRIGEGATCHWKMGSPFENTTIGFYFDTVGQRVQKRHGFLQLQTKYMHPAGQTRLRVTTVSHAYADLATQEILTGFDYEAAAILVFRHAVNKTDNGERDNVETWLDDKIVRLMKTFATWREKDVASLTVDVRIAWFVQMVYHLQRSWLLNSISYRLDESAHRCALVLREKNCHVCRIMQPSMLRYSYSCSCPEAVPLDMSSIEKDAVLILDTYFHVACVRGEKVQQWCEHGYQHNGEYQFFGDWLAIAHNNVKQLTTGKLISPRFLQGWAARRFLNRTVDPIAQGRNSLKAFMEDLLCKVVQDP